MTEFARRDEPRAGLEHDRSAQDNVVDDHVPGRLGMQYLFDPLIERHQRAQAEDHHRDDKDPEIELQPIAEGVLRVGRLLGAAHAEEQQELVPGIDRRMDRFAVHGRAVGDQRRPEFADRDRDIAGDRRDDDPERARMFRHYPASAAPPLCYNYGLAVVGGRSWVSQLWGNPANLIRWPSG